MGILKQLANPLFKVTKSDRILIQYISENKEDVVYKSISEIAKESKIAEATVTRFTKKLGFNNFQEFKITLAQELSINEERTTIYSNISRFESIHETAINLLKSTTDVLQKTVDYLDVEMMVKCKEVLLNAQKIYLMGIGHSGVIATDFNYKLMRIGLNTLSVSDSHTMLMLASIMNPGDVIVMISHSGETNELIQTAQIAKKQEVTLISVTTDVDNSLRLLSDINLNYQSNETIFETGSIRSKIPQMFILDLVYTEIIKQKYSESLTTRLKTTDAIVNYKYHNLK